MEDSTNKEEHYTRNRIRNQLLPLVKEQINPGATEHLLQAGQWIRQADAYLEGQAERWLAGQGEAPDLKALAAQDEPLPGYIIRCLLRDQGYPLRDVTAGHIHAILALAEKETGKRVNLPGGVTAMTEYGVLKFCRDQEKRQENREKRRRSAADEQRKEAEEEPQEWQKEETGGTKIQLAEGRLLFALRGFYLKAEVFPCKNPVDFPQNQYTKWFDYDKINHNLSVRFRRPGDYITLAGGGRKLLKAYLIDEKVPQRMRGQIPLLAEGSHILWIMGRRISEYYKVTKDTKRILQIQADKGEYDGR